MDRQPLPSNLVEDAARMVGEEKSAEYGTLLSRASKMVVEGKDLQKAAKKCRKAILLFPDLPAGHSTLGSVHEASGAPTMAAQCYLAAMERFDENSTIDPKLWADSAAHAYAMCVASKGDPTPAWWPMWWEDEALLRLSERAVSLIPDSLRAQKWRADVLSGLQSALPPMEPRSPQQLRDAAACFQKTAELVASSEGKRSMVKAGIACRARAAAIEQHFAQEGSHSGTTATFSY